ncbi:MAG TPA: N-acetyl sugar amidotransferase [Syntrophales bacterium]|nr:N-acetyl sugar amidotransferase [Syntrophales bacterium]HOM08452.1 N-acetyl sugar amidotransferase [Syntrophales bacterium]HOO00996.1 N-acetyl sugar amidotransferase [Syntrophales bacterium]
MRKDYRICTRCIMDTSDPDITFDEEGVCSHCRRYERLVKSPEYLEKKKPGALDRLVAEIKAAGRGKPYDCILGVSGGVDSTYSAYLVKKLGLRPLAVHLDNCWNTSLAEANIRKATEILDIDLEICKVDWEGFRDLQLAFLKASTPDSEIPTDHALLACLYYVAAREGVRFIISGHNMATEGGGVPAWSQGHGDWRYIKGVHRLFGTRRLGKYYHYGPWGFFYYTVLRRIRWVPLLDYIDYVKDEVVKVLKERLAWEPYEAKHYESVYTRFYQGYILPRKFGFDKRRLHLSSLVWSGQLSRAEALEEMVREHYPEEQLKLDKTLFLEKMGISAAEFEAIMKAPTRTFWDYPSYKRLPLFRSKTLRKLYHRLKRD